MPNGSSLGPSSGHLELPDGSEARPGWIFNAVRTRVRGLGYVTDNVTVNLDVSQFLGVIHELLHPGFP